MQSDPGDFKTGFRKFWRRPAPGISKRDFANVGDTFQPRGFQNGISQTGCCNILEMAGKVITINLTLSSPGDFMAAISQRFGDIKKTRWCLTERLPAPGISWRDLATWYTEQPSGPSKQGDQKQPKGKSGLVHLHVNVFCLFKNK